MGIENGKMEMIPVHSKCLKSVDKQKLERDGFTRLLLCGRCAALLSSPVIFRERRTLSLSLRLRGQVLKLTTLSLFISTAKKWP